MISFYRTLLWISTILVLINVLHPGRTDSKGGHYNRSTGEYHYHHGYSEHQHYDMDGDGKKDCPYDFDDKTNHNSGSNSSGNYYSGSQTGLDDSQNEENSIETDNRTKWLIVLLIALLGVFVTSGLFIIQKNSEYTGYSHSLKKGFTKGIDTIVQANYIPPKGVDTIHLNYLNIDETIKRESEIQDHLWRIQNQYKEKTDRVSSAITIFFIVSGIACIAIIFAILFIFVFKESPWVALIAATILSLIAYVKVFVRIAAKNEEIDETFKKYITSYANIETYKLCDKLLNSFDDLNQFIGIPPHVTFVNQMPSTSSVENSSMPYGSFTRFIAPYAGKCFHQKEGCSGAFHPVNLYSVINNRTPCSKCAYSDNNRSVPEWYQYYIKLNVIIEKKKNAKL